MLISYLDISISIIASQLWQILMLGECVRNSCSQNGAFATQDFFSLAFLFVFVLSQLFILFLRLVICIGDLTGNSKEFSLIMALICKSYCTEAIAGLHFDAEFLLQCINEHFDYQWKK